MDARLTILLALAALSCYGDTISIDPEYQQPAPTAKIRIFPRDPVLPLGRQIPLNDSIQITPAGWPTAVIWSSRDSAIVSVSDQGVITAKAVGSAVVRAVWAVYPGWSDSVLVTVPSTIVIKNP
jgi:hypothetical protein